MEETNIETLTIYLAGKCKGLLDEGKTWREEISKKLETIAEWDSKKVHIINPVNYFSYNENKHKTNKQVKDYFMSRISKCDLVIVNLNESDSSVGTAQEIQYAVDHNIPVVGFGINNVYSWISEVDCQVAFATMTETIDYVRDYYLN